MCMATFLSPAFDEGDHEDIVGNTANLTNADVNRQSFRVLKRDFLQRGQSTDIQVFSRSFKSEKTPSRPRLVDPHNCSRIVSHQSCSTRQRNTFRIFDRTLISTEIVVCVVWYKEVSSTQLAVSSQEALLCRPWW